MFSDCFVFQSKRTHEAAKDVIDEGLEPGEIAGTSGQDGHDGEEKDIPKV